MSNHFQIFNFRTANKMRKKNFMVWNENGYYYNCNHEKQVEMPVETP